MNYLLDLEKLVNTKKDFYKMDLHIHSFHSADGKDSVQSIIDRAIANSFDIISITDHDTCKAYQEIASGEINTRGITIIPGIELSVYNKMYGSMFHVLQYGFDWKDKYIESIIEYNRKANIFRFKYQCKLLGNNPIYKYIANDNDENIENNICRIAKSYPPDYIDIARYIYDLATQKNFSLYDILTMQKEFIDLDDNPVRQRINRMNLEKIYKRISSRRFDPVRLIMKIIANSDSEDSNFKDSVSTGNISVSNYGQLTMENVSNKFVTVLAHPSYDKYLNSNFAHRFCLCTLKIQYLAVIQLSKVCCYAA